jgi:hypothetical protein
MRLISYAGGTNFKIFLKGNVFPMMSMNACIDLWLFYVEMKNTWNMGVKLLVDSVWIVDILVHKYCVQY